MPLLSDALVCNAGALLEKREKTVEGHEVWTCVSQWCISVFRLSLLICTCNERHEAIGPSLNNVENSTTSKIRICIKKRAEWSHQNGMLWQGNQQGTPTIL